MLKKKIFEICRLMIKSKLRMQLKFGDLPAKQHYQSHLDAFRSGIFVNILHILRNLGLIVNAIYLVANGSHNSKSLYFLILDSIFYFLILGSIFVHAKGQTKSYYFFQASNSSKKGTNKPVFFCLLLNCFVHFLEEFKGRKNFFQD